VKKYLRIITLLSALLLAACSETEDVPKEIVTDEDGAGRGEITKDEPRDITEEVKESHLMAGYTLSNIVDTYGYVSDLADFYLSKYDAGLVYAKLVDFNKDGIDELFVLFKANTYISSSMSHRETGGYVIEIWGDDGESYSPFYARTVEIDKCSACDLSVGFLEFDDGSYGYYESSAQAVQGTTYSNETIYYMKDYTSFEKTVFKSAYNEKITYEIDGEALEEEEFKAQRELYNGTDIPIIEGYFGTKSFVHGAESSAAIVNAIYKEIDYAFNDVGADAAKVDPASVQAYAERILKIDHVRANSAHYMEQMITYAILYEGLEADLPSYKYFLAVSEQAVAAKVKEVFGVELDLSETNLPDPDDDVGFFLISYRDGAFYITPTDFYSPTVIRRTVEKAWKVEEDMYYMVVSDIKFDLMTYSTASDAAYEEMNHFIDQPITKWPAEARKNAVSDIRRYILVKLVDGQPTVKYIGYSPLTMDEINEF
jgi:hypothetical protein